MVNTDPRRGGTFITLRWLGRPWAEVEGGRGRVRSGAPQTPTPTIHLFIYRRDPDEIDAPRSVGPRTNNVKAGGVGWTGVISARISPNVKGCVSLNQGRCSVRPYLATATTPSTPALFPLWRQPPNRHLEQHGTRVCSRERGRETTTNSGGGD